MGVRKRTGLADLADATARAILARIAPGEAPLTEPVKPFAINQPSLEDFEVLERRGSRLPGRTENKWGSAVGRPSRQFGNDEWVPVIPREHLVCLLISRTRHRARVEMQRAPKPIRDVRKMNQNDGWDCLLERCVQIRLFPRPHSLNEVGPVVNAFIPGLLAARAWPRFLLFPEEGLVPFGAAEIPFRAVDDVANGGVCAGRATRHLVGYGKDVSLAIRNPMPHFKNEHFTRTLVELEARNHGVGGLLIVIKHEVPAGCRYLGWVFDTEEPSS